MIQQIDFSRFSDSQTTAVSVDPIVDIGYVRSLFLASCTWVCQTTTLFNFLVLAVF